jgi:hypothetical protein
VRERFERAAQRLVHPRARALTRRDVTPAEPGLVVLACLLLATIGALAVRLTLADLGPLAAPLDLGDPCPDLPVSLIRLEVTYWAPRFAALLGAEAACRARVIASFWPDFLLALTYPLLLSSLYLWAERWRQVSPRGRREPPSDAPEALRAAAVTRRHHFFAVAPLLAGGCDLVENGFLLWAAHVVAGPGASPRVSVFLGSAAATAKWILLLGWAVGTAAEVLSGPRGLVLRRLRFSVLAVALGALPLLVVPQGRDILQRLVEGEHPTTRVLAAVAALVFGATAVWYCGRKLLQLRFREDPLWHATAWYRHFAERTPRILGIAVLALAGAAFAREGDAAGWFLGSGALGALAVIVARWRGAALAARLGRALTFGNLAHVQRRSFYERTGDVAFALVATVAGWLAASAWARSHGPRPPAWLATWQALTSEAEWHLRLAAWLCLGLAWVFYLLVYYRRDWARAVTAHGGHAAQRAAEVVARTPADSIALDALDRNLVSGFWAAVVAGLAFFAAFTWLAVPVARFLGPLVVLSVAASGAVFLGSVTVWVYGRFRVPVVRLLVALALLFGLWNENHPVRRVPHPDPAAVTARPTLPVALNAWVRLNVDSSHPLPAPDSEPVLLVAASGGGLRAAYWAATVLAALQDREPSTARRVFALSGVSGGSLGVALYAALARDLSAGTPLRCTMPDSLSAEDTAGAPGRFTRCVRRFMRDDFLSPVLAKTVAPDLAQRLLPIPLRLFDRSTALEASWDSSYRATTRRATFGEGMLALGGALGTSGSSPVLLLNATHVETGERYVASTAALDGAMADTRDLLSVLRSDLPLSVAVHNSARFTYVSPAGHLDRDDGVELGRVVDGGYFENSGLASLQEVYALIAARNRAARSGTRPLRPVVLYLCNDPGPCGRESSVRADMLRDSAIAAHATWANELLAPARAVLDARGARGALARAELQRAARDDFFQFNVCDRLLPERTVRHAPAVESTTVDTAALRQDRERVVAPPLGWLLSGRARRWMDASIPAAADAQQGTCPSTNRAMLTRLAALLRAHPLPPLQAPAPARALGPGTSSAARMQDP